MKQNSLKSAELLKPVIANQFIIYVKARNYHWNVKGNQFYGLHSLFEKIYDELAKDIDVLAERIRALGVYAPGSMNEFLSLASLKEESAGVYPEQMQMLGNISSDFELLVNELKVVAKKLQSDLEDEVTAGIVYGMIEKYEKSLWMYNSSLNK